MAGEKSGSLEQVLRRYVAHIKVLLGVRSQVISALIYPAVLILLSAGVVSMIVFKVVPQFAEFYAGYGEGAVLPMSTRIVVAISTALLERRAVHPAGPGGASSRGAWHGSGSPSSAGGCTPACCGCRSSGRSRANWRPRRCPARWRRCSPGASRW